MKKISTVSALLLLFFSCEKDVVFVTYDLNHVSSTTFYTNEIFSADKFDLNGRWMLLEKVAGGGRGYVGYYDSNHFTLEIKAFGIYGIYRHDTLIEYGRLSPSKSYLIATNEVESVSVSFYKTHLYLGEQNAYHPFELNRLRFILRSADVLSLHQTIEHGSSFLLARR